MDLTGSLCFDGKKIDSVTGTCFFYMYLKDVELCSFMFKFVCLLCYVRVRWVTHPKLLD